jgi:hypothetical protein
MAQQRNDRHQRNVGATSGATGSAPCLLNATCKCTGMAASEQDENMTEMVQTLENCVNFYD